MNKNDLIYRVAGKTGQSKASVAEVIGAVLDVIQAEVASGGDVRLSGFGTFQRVYRAPRPVRNPNTGQTSTSAGKHVPVFRPGTGFKNTVATG